MVDERGSKRRAASDFDPRCNLVTIGREAKPANDRFVPKIWN